MNTRFRPTPYRDLHLGHVWVAWRNWVVAAKHGAEFVLIADDVAYNLGRLFEQSWSATAAAQRMCDDLQWLRMAPTQVVFSTRNAEAHAEAARELNLRLPGRAAHESFQGPIIRDPAGTQVTMYHAWLVCVRVVDDFLAGIGAFVRGAELTHEAQLYDHFWRTLYGVTPPCQEYVPVVRREDSTEKESKSTGSLTVRDLRAAGYTARQIIDTLRECDFRSREQGLRDLVIPAGVLEVPEVCALVCRDSYAQRQAQAAKTHRAEGQPWARDVARLAKRWRAIEKGA